jgi:flagellar biosynthetic protein FliR
LGVIILAIDLGPFVGRLDLFLLVIVRMTSLFVISPIFGRQNLPTAFKIGFAVMCSIILVNVIQLPDLAYANNIILFAILVVKEFAVGLIIGFISYLIFTAIYLAGQIIDTQIGFGIVNVLDPISNIQIPITANLYYILTTLFFLMINGHHMIISALFKSFEIIPPGQEAFQNVMVAHLVKVMLEVFTIAIKLSTPVIIAILLSDVVLGIISRSMPEMNIFVVGMPLKIAVGLIISSSSGIDK